MDVWMLLRDSPNVWVLQYVRVAEWGVTVYICEGCDVWGLPCWGVALWGLPSYGVAFWGLPCGGLPCWWLQCVEIDVYGICSVWELMCLGVAICESL